MKRLTLQACAVNIVRNYPDIPDSDQVELVKRLAVRRGIRYQFGGEITEALERAKRYEPNRKEGSGQVWLIGSGMK